MKEIRLDGAGTSCVIECAEDGWCQVELHAPDGIILIGVQSIRYFASRIIDFLERPREGRQWILFLLGQNVSVHGERLDDFMFFTFADETEKFLASISLDPVQQRTWLGLLTPYIMQQSAPRFGRKSPQS